MKLSFEIIKSKIEAEAVLVIVHGMEEHKKRYRNFAEYLTGKGINVLIYDLPGHGDSKIFDEEPGYFGQDGWNTLLTSVDEMVQTAHEQFPELPVFLMGHSMGSIISRCYIQKHDSFIDGLILTGIPNYQPAAGLGIILGKIQRLFKGDKGRSRLMTQMVTGNFNKAVKNPKTELDWLSYNEENVSNYITDAECGVEFTIQGYIDLLTGVRQMHEVSRFECKNSSMPILILAGQDDPCTGGDSGFADSVNTLHKAGYQEITEKKYPEMRHEILNEYNNHEVYMDIARWLESLLTA